MVARFRARADSGTARQIDALCWRGRGVSAASLAPRLPPIRKRLDDGGRSETTDSDDSVADPAAEQSGRVEPLLGASVAELAGISEPLLRLRRYADGSGRSPVSFGGTGHLTMNDRLTASRVREWVGKSARFFSVVSVPPWLFFSPQRYGGHGKIRGSLIAADPRRRGQSRLFCRQAVSSPLRRVPPNHQVETNRCQASRLRSWPVTGDSFPVCHGALTAAVAHPGR